MHSDQCLMILLIKVYEIVWLLNAQHNNWISYSVFKPQKYFLRCIKLICKIFAVGSMLKKNSALKRSLEHSAINNSQPKVPRS